MKKKIGILIGQLAQIGGVGIAAIEEVRNLNKLGIKTELLVLYKNPRSGFSSNSLADLPIRYLWDEFPGWAKINFNIPGFNFLSSFHLISPLVIHKIIKPKDYDLIIVHETYNCWSALKLKKKNDTPFIPFLWDPVSYILPRVYKDKMLGKFIPLLLPLAKHFDRQFVKHSYKTFVGSDLHLEKLKFLVSTRDVKKIKIVYAGAHPQKKYPETNRKYLLALTKWDIGKNPDFLLEVIKLIDNNSIKLIVAGNWYSKQFKDGFIKKIQALRLDNRIIVVGRVSEQTKIELCQNAIALIHPIIEAFGLFALEAAGCGCPVVMPKGSGVGNILTNEQAGFFPKEGDAQAFAKYLNYLIADKTKRNQIGKAAWEVANKYTWLDHAK